MANSQHAEHDPKHVNTSGEVPATCAPGQPDGVTAVPGTGAGPVPVPCAITSFAAASELLSAPCSGLVMNTHRRHIALSPMYLNRMRTGIQEELKDELLRFSQSFNGVPVAYENIQVIGETSAICNDTGYIHMNIQANFIVFQPKQGDKLRGKVNKLGVSHVGCLVHGYFNASIPKPHLVTMETWRDAGPRVGSELEFEVTAIDTDAVGVLLIRGKLDRTRVQELLAMAESTESSVAAEESDQPDAGLAPEPTPEPAQECPDNTPKKKKKKKKDKIKEEEREEAITAPPSYQQDGNTTAELMGNMKEENGNDAVEKKKKKKKKEKQLKEEEEEVELSCMEVHGSDSSGYHSNKPSKKRKHEPDITSSFSEEPPKSKKKKKRKSEVEQFA
ncbi:DNA-directed RNA polymerase I subunit RPA43 [Sphaeramia orbicularis]|uniref:DNA-directed RNA polymerase subunit n=1 Tax=Sphaeramia orbicularis TaxID=375764 RepID=A0A672YBN7_9TELE|nr:DNA-directed RNA polymerase I subunit RPA43 [Sphaeramia orbicularis]